MPISAPSQIDFGRCRHRSGDASAGRRPMCYTIPGVRRVGKRYRRIYNPRQGRSASAMPHVALLGDSIFDNQSYVQPGEPDVIRQLQGRLPADWEATLLAVDGSVTTDIRHQLAHLPTDATHLVISVGGNDALGQLDVLASPANSVAEAIARLAAIQDQFEPTYRS